MNAVPELAAAVERLLRYIDSAHGDDFREKISHCAIPGDLVIERVRDALIAVREEIKNEQTTTKNPP